MNLIWKIYTVYNKIAIDLILYILRSEHQETEKANNRFSCEVKVQESHIQGGA